MLHEGSKLATLAKYFALGHAEKLSLCLMYLSPSLHSQPQELPEREREAKGEGQGERERAREKEALLTIKK